MTITARLLEQLSLFLIIEKQAIEVTTMLLLFYDTTKLMLTY